LFNLIIDIFYKNLLFYFSKLNKNISFANYNVFVFKTKQQQTKNQLYYEIIFTTKIKII